MYSAIDFPGAVLTNAQGINAGGEIVGSYNDAGTPSKTHGYVLSGGQFRSIDFPGARVTNARGIGPRGDIVELPIKRRNRNRWRAQLMVLC